MKIYSNLKETFERLKTNFSGDLKDTIKPMVNERVSNSIDKMENVLNEILKVGQKQRVSLIEKFESGMRRDDELRINDYNAILSCNSLDADKTEIENSKNLSDSDKPLSNREEYKSDNSFTDEIIQIKEPSVYEIIKDETKLNFESNKNNDLDNLFNNSITVRYNKPEPIDFNGFSDEFQRFSSSDSYSFTSFNLKKFADTNVGLLNLISTNIKNSKSNRDCVLSIMKKIENNFSNTSQGIRLTINTSNSESNLINEQIFIEEIETEGLNLFLLPNNKEIQFISIHLLLESIFECKDRNKFSYLISNSFIIQLEQIIALENLIELMKSYLNKNKHKNLKGMLNMLNNILIHKYRSEIIHSDKERLGLIDLYDELVNAETVVDFNGVKRIEISKIKEILRSSDIEKSYLKIKELEGSHLFKGKINFNSLSPILPISFSHQFDILQWSEVEIARQLTIVTFHLFSNIPLTEFINTKWKRAEKKNNTSSSSITKIIQRFNKLSLWACEEILAYDRAKHRAMVIEKFILVANELKNMNNYNDCFAIISCLNSSQIKTLAKSFRRVSLENCKILKDLNNFCSSTRNFGSLREETETCILNDKRCIPYLGYYLKELLLIEEGTNSNSNANQTAKYIMQPNLVNIEKIKKVGRILDIIGDFQKRNYQFKPVFKLAFLSDLKPSNEEQLMELSSKLEPKFILNQNKNLKKRFISYDVQEKYNSIPNTFNSLIEFLNVDKSNKSLKDQIKLYFTND